ncbi:MAG TPA: GNAT family N-acetyltransferase [Cytophagaceae bacterium]|nr:GNAT family N-acetyltransferase [Cytophagaceae bacterium]
MNYKVKKLGKEDIQHFINLIRLFEDVFEMQNFSMLDQEHLSELLSQEKFLVFVALLDDEVIGGTTAYCMIHYYSKREIVFLYDLAVAEEMQRKGVGAQLINALKDHCKQSGAEVIFLEAEETDPHAVEFYRSTGAAEAKGYFFSYDLND